MKTGERATSAITWLPHKLKPKSTSDTYRQKVTPSTDYECLSEADGCSSWCTGAKPCTPDITETNKQTNKQRGNPTLTYCSHLFLLQRAELDPFPSSQ